MANLATDFLGIKSPNPFWLASSAKILAKQCSIVLAIIFLVTYQANSKERKACNIKEGTTVEDGTIVGGNICINGEMLDLEQWARQELLKEEHKAMSDDFFSTLEEICEAAVCKIVP